jgi:hypothetical protein
LDPAHGQNIGVFHITTTSIALTEQITDLVTGALDSGTALLLAAVDSNHRPVLSFRGSTAVYSDAQLCFWARKPAGEMLDAVRQNPHVAFMYRSLSVPLLQFSGRARISEDPAERDRVFCLGHEKERAADPDRKGRAVIVDLDEVKGLLGFNAQGPILVHMTRS